MKRVKGIFALLIALVIVTGCSKESITNEDASSPAVAANVTNPAALAIGHGMSAFTLAFENIPASDKAVFHNTATSSMSDSQKMAILTANPNTNLLMNKLANLSTALSNNQGFMDIQSNADMVTQVFVDDLDIGAVAGGVGCAAAYTVCMAYGVNGCLWIPPCVAGVTAVCTAALAICLATTSTAGEEEEIDYLNDHPLKNTILFYISQP